MLTYSIIISGKVQGVFFRQTAKEKADASGITGEVMNLQDGRVQIIATGTKEQLQVLNDWCHKGPARATVENVMTEEIPLRTFHGFKVIRH